jgi:hypothetical protein
LRAADVVEVAGVFWPDRVQIRRPTPARRLPAVRVADGQLDQVRAPAEALVAICVVGQGTGLDLGDGSVVSVRP